ncbi:MAG: hypothetical protein ACP5I8_16030 [Phycisphaerae bacterium]
MTTELMKLVHVDLRVSEPDITAVEHLIYTGEFERLGLWVRQLNGVSLSTPEAVRFMHRIAGQQNAMQGSKKP